VKQDDTGSCDKMIIYSPKTGTYLEIQLNDDNKFTGAREFIGKTTYRGETVQLLEMLDKLD